MLFMLGSDGINSFQYIPIPIPFWLENQFQFSFAQPKVNSNSFFPIICFNNIVTFLYKIVVTYYGNYNGTISTYDPLRQLLVGAVTGAQGDQLIYLWNLNLYHILLILNKTYFYLRK